MKLGVRLENSRGIRFSAQIGGDAATKHPIKNLRSELERSISRAWEGLTEGWREVLVRSGGALTHFVRAAKDPGTHKAFPQYALLAAESWETAQSLIFRIEIPGMSKEDMQISIDRGVLRVRGERRAPDHPTRRYMLMERAFGRFERTLPLPHDIDASKAEVSYQDGVITVIVPKTKAIPPTHLSVP